VTRDHDVRLGDGRVLRTRDTGASGGDVVLLLHEPLGSRLVVDGLSATATDVGLRLVSYDRPGYGGSTPKPGRTIADAAAEVAAIADELGVDRFAVWGHSGGCPFALACAVLLPDRVVAAAVVSPLAPYQAPGLDWFAGMMDDVAQLHRLAAAGHPELQPALSQLAQALTATDPAQFIEFSRPTLPPPDQAILNIGVATRLLDGMREGLAAGVEGAVQDELALLAPWDVELASVGVPVSVWSGEQDRDTPTSHARWLAAAIPGAELRLSPEEGHLSLVYGRGREVIDWLAERLRRAR
jgi:pimeloyl-ACP methyl ester carboxylesterase